jgi:hypothetical protein
VGFSGGSGGDGMLGNLFTDPEFDSESEVELTAGHENKT